MLDIHPSILKENNIWFSNHLVELFNFSLVKSVFPSVLKITRVTLGHKSGAVGRVDNYRLISVLPFFSKMFEKLTLTRMNGFIERHNILTICQFGFRKRHSTTQAIVKLLSHIVQAYHKKIYSACYIVHCKFYYKGTSKAACVCVPRDASERILLLLPHQPYGNYENCDG